MQSLRWTAADTIIGLLLLLLSLLIWATTRYVVLLPYFNFRSLARL